MFKNLIALATLLLFSFLTSAHSEIISSTSTGVVGDGYYDGQGLFGKEGANLSGLEYSATISFDRALNTDYKDAAFLGHPYYSYDSYGSAPGTVSVTINSITYSTSFYSVNGNDTYTRQFISNGKSLSEPGYYDLLGGYAEGYKPDNSYTYAYHYLSSYNNSFGIPTADLGKTYSHTFQPGDNKYADFVFTSGVTGKTTRFYGDISTLTLNGGEVGSGTDSTSVPEPTSVALLSLGLLGFAASRRKSAKNKST